MKSRLQLPCHHHHDLLTLLSFPCSASLFSLNLPFLKRGERKKTDPVTAQLSPLCSVTRSRLADFHTNCQVSFQSLTSCPGDNYQACLGSYAGMIGKSVRFVLWVWAWEGAVAWSVMVAGERVWQHGYPYSPFLLEIYWMVAEGVGRNEQVEKNS